MSANNKAFCLLIVIPLLSSCMPTASDTLMVEQPKTRPIRNITSFTPALDCMDGLLAKQGISNRDITSTDIPDKTNKLALGAKDMLINAISKMSRNSQAFRYLDYETASSADKTDTIQNITNIIGVTSNGSNGLKPPEVYIRGSISQVNDDAVTANQGVGVDVSQANLSANRDISISTITLDLQLFDMPSRTLIPGMSSSNVIAVTRNGEGVDVGAKIQTAGVSFQFNDSESESSGQAVRNLVELGVIELLGKWTKVPYWSCLNIDSTNPMARSETKAWYDAMDQEDRVKFYKSGLQYFGYYKGAIDGHANPELKSALTQYQTDKGLIPSGVENFETYSSLINSGAKFSQITKEIPSSKQPLFLGPHKMDVNIVTREKKSIKSGENIGLMVSVSEKAYLRCFYKDEENTIMMVYPNPYQQDGEIPGNQAIKIGEVGGSFEIKASIGSHEFLCLATNIDLKNNLPAYLKVQPLNPIGNVRSLNEILSDVEIEAKGIGLSYDKKTIIVSN